MKCPKCGYNSFEYNDICSRCSNDLTGYKQTYGLESLVIPSLARAAVADSLKAGLFAEEHAQEPADNGSDMFSFDLPDDELSSGAGGLNDNDPFNFDTQPEAPSAAPFTGFPFESTPQQAGTDDPFADLLEQSSPAPSPAAVQPAAASSSEFDLENFSWDDTPVAAGADATSPEHELDSLFGDSETKK